MKLDTSHGLPLSVVAPPAREAPPQQRERAPLVIVILTRDEELNLGKALASIAGRVPVVVVDSESTDGTRRIAEAGGAEAAGLEVRDWVVGDRDALDPVGDVGARIAEAGALLSRGTVLLVDVAHAARRDRRRAGARI